MLFTACSPTAVSSMAAVTPRPTQTGTAVPVMPTSTQILEIVLLPAPTYTPTSVPTMPPVSASPLPDVSFATSSPPPLIPSPVPTIVNGLTLADFLVMDEVTRQNMRDIYQYGQDLGRKPHAFSKLGDSGAMTGYYLTRFDYPPHYTLGEFAFLQPVIDYYKDSYERFGVATVVGLSSWQVLDPALNNPSWCEPQEHMLACEIRLHNPSLLFIRLGTNDASSAEVLERNLRHIVAFSIEQGVIPILATKADRFEEEYDQNNAAIRRVAADMHIPLWDFDHVAATLPNRGLLTDQVHLSHSERNDYTDPDTFTKGYAMNDLTALFVLQEILAIINGENTPNYGNHRLTIGD